MTFHWILLTWNLVIMSWSYHELTQHKLRISCDPDQDKAVTENEGMKDT